MIQDLVVDEKEAPFLCLPLLNQNNVIGLFFVQYLKGSRKAKGKLNKNNVLEEAIAKQLSLSISNIKLRNLLESQAVHDPLTGLLNRRYIDHTLQRELYQAQRYSRPLSVIMIDIDYFKNINDTYGHKAGDTTLKETARLLQEKSRKEDIVCRFGGEEFLIVMQETTQKRALERADEIRKAVEGHSFSFNAGQTKKITISLGISAFPENGQSIEDLILRADQALYKAKKQGRNRVETAEPEALPLSV